MGNVHLYASVARAGDAPTVAGHIARALHPMWGCAHHGPVDVQLRSKKFGFGAVATAVQPHVGDSTGGLTPPSLIEVGTIGEDGEPRFDVADRAQVAALNLAWRRIQSEREGAGHAAV